MTENRPWEIERLQQRLEGWRMNRKGRLRIPERFWNAAVELARSYGVWKVAKALRLDYYNLKERCDGTAGASAATNQAAPSFIEVAPSPALQIAECVIELENADGGRIRMHFKGERLPNAESVCTEFLKNRR